MTITVARLQQERQRAHAAGMRGGRAFDIEAAMATMREQGYDPHRQLVELVFGPAPVQSAYDERLERFIFRIAGSKPMIEIEVELPPGQLREAEWTPADRARLGARTASVLRSPSSTPPATACEDTPMPVVRFDHASVPTDHPEEMMAFYESMGFTILDADSLPQRRAPDLSRSPSGTTR